MNERAAVASDGWDECTVGVIGGLGPAATVTFLDQLVRFTDAHHDQEHLDAVVLQHSTTPDRSAYILDPDAAPDPGPVLAADARRLESLGVAFLVLPCNTAHYFRRAIDEACSLDLLSIVGETARAAVQRVSERAARGEVAPDAPIGVFATEGNIAARAYQDELDALGARWEVPPPPVQHDVNTLIYDQVKAGRDVDLDLFDRTVAAMTERGCGAVILGCTELSVIHDRFGMAGRAELVDSLLTLTRATIHRAGRRLREDRQ